jgi:hypothetical protein
MSGKLIDLALSATHRFPEIATATLPRLVTIDRHSAVLAHVNVDEKIFAHHHRTLLDLMSVALSPDPGMWPYGTSEILGRLAEQPETRGDPRLAALQRYEQRT